MIKRTLLAIGMMATLFSANADLMTYTFSGSYTSGKNIGGVNITDPVSISYSFNLDFNQPGLYEGKPKGDFTETLLGGNQIIKYDVASASFSAGSNFYYPDRVETDVLALAYIADENYYGTPNKYSGISFMGNGSNRLISNQLYISCGGVFEMKKSCFVVERFEDYANNSSYEAKGNLTLTSITKVNPPSSVPEPGTMTLMAGSLLALTGLGYRRKKA